MKENDINGMNELDGRTPSFDDWKDVRDSADGMEENMEYAYDGNYYGPEKTTPTETFTEEQIRRMEQGFDDWRDVRDSAENMEKELEYPYDGEYYGAISHEPEPEPELKPEEKIEEEIAKFKLHVEKITSIINKIKSSLILTGDLSVDFNEMISSLTAEISELAAEADSLISEIESLKTVLEGEVLSLDIKEIRKTVKELKARLKELKIHHLQLYNMRVAMINSMIDDLLLNVKLTEEMKSKLESLRLTQLDIVIRSWEQKKYLEQIDFNIFVTVINEIKQIVPEIEKSDEVIDLESEMTYIEKEIERLEKFPKDDLSSEELAALQDECRAIADRINDFRIKYENIKDKLNEDNVVTYIKDLPDKERKIEPYTYATRINDAEANIALVFSKFKQKEYENPKNNKFKELSDKLDDLDRDIVHTSNNIETLYGKITEAGVLVLKADLEVYASRLEEIKLEIEESYKAEEIDINQYNTLQQKVQEVEKALELAFDKVKDPEMIVGVDIFAYLNGRIDGIENALDELEKQVDALEKPIKDKEVRKQIDQIIDKLVEEIKYLENILEKNKEEDPEKYKETKERLDKVKERLEKVSKNYRKKCPFLIRKYKSAKAFYKKHKKACLIVAGLAALSIAFSPILIPAIMHGNIMIGSTAPALSGFTNFVNNILGGMIGATKSVNRLWILSNGITLNPTLASTSLLKGLATAGLASSPYIATLMAPAIIAVKKLVEKMKNVELKQKIEEKFKKEKGKKTKTKKDGHKKAVRKTEEEIMQLFKRYRKSGMDVKQFCETEELTEEEKAMLEYYDARMRKNMEEKTETSGRGRR